MKKISLILYIILTTFFASNSLYAQEGVTKLVKKYIEAVKEKNDVAIEAAWNELYESPEDLAYLKEKFPDYYRLFKLHGLTYRVNKIRKTYFGPSLETEPATAKSISEGKSLTNKDVAIKYSNQNRTSNSDLLKSFSNNDRVSNSTYMRNFSNRNNVSNQDRLRRRR